MVEYSYSSKLNDSWLIKPTFSFNSEDDTTKYDNNSNLNNMDSNQSLIFNHTINDLNQNEIINDNESDKSINFGLFNDTSNSFINFDFNIPSHFNQDYSNNLKKNDTIKLPDNKFLNRKRKLFDIKYPNEFFIFSRGGANKDKRKIIDQFLQNKENINNIYNERAHSLKTRKENADNIRKKIKCRFIKKLKEFINQKLKLAGSKKFFALLPQIFVCNISKDKNRIMLDKTFKELFSFNFSEDENDANFKNYKKNIDTLKYLENKKDISEKSNYNCYKNLKLYQIFDEYLRSKEFENEIINLELKGEKDNYIYNFIKLACNLNNFFSE